MQVPLMCTVHRGSYEPGIVRVIHTWSVSNQQRRPHVHWPAGHPLSQLAAQVAVHMGLSLTLDLLRSRGCCLAAARDLQDPQMPFGLYWYAAGGDVLWQAQLL